MFSVLYKVGKLLVTTSDQSVNFNFYLFLLIVLIWLVPFGESCLSCSILEQYIVDHDGDACVCVVDGNFTMIRCDAYQSKLLLLCGDEEILLFVCRSAKSVVVSVSPPKDFAYNIWIFLTLTIGEVIYCKSE